MPKENEKWVVFGCVDDKVKDNDNNKVMQLAFRGGTYDKNAYIAKVDTKAYGATRMKEVVEIVAKQDGCKTRTPAECKAASAHN